MLSTLLRSLYVCYTELKKRVSRVLIMPGICFFVKAKRDLEMLPPTHHALELHIKRQNYQDKILLQAGYAIINLENDPTETIGWQAGTYHPEVVWKCLPAIPKACN